MTSSPISSKPRANRANSLSRAGVLSDPACESQPGIPRNLTYIPTQGLVDTSMVTNALAFARFAREHAQVADVALLADLAALDGAFDGAAVFMRVSAVGIAAQVDEGPKF